MEQIDLKEMPTEGLVFLKESIKMELQARKLKNKTAKGIKKSQKTKKPMITPDAFSKMVDIIKRIK